MQTLKWLPRPAYNYDGFVVFFKGDPNAKAAESTQLAFTNQLMNIFQAQYGKQASVLDYLTNQMKSQVANPTGYRPEDLSAMRTQSADTIAQGATNAKQAAANATSVASGGSKLAGVAGTTLMSQAAIDAAQQAEEASANNNITMANANLRNANYWNATNVLGGTAASFDPLGYSGQGLEGGKVVADLSQANTAANGPTAGEILGKVAGGALGAAGDIFKGGFAAGGAFA
jgi:hypothetical protein